MPLYSKGIRGASHIGVQCGGKRLYETEDAVHVHTNLLGPEKGEETKDAATFPYVVIQLEYIEKEVLLD